MKNDTRQPASCRHGQAPEPTARILAIASQSPQTDSQPNRWHPHAALAAWLLPGLGHFILGQRQRGAILCATIGTLWLSGMIIGGISVFDHREHPAWFVGQMLMAPSVAMDVTLVTKLKPYPGPISPPAPPDYVRPAYEPSYGRVNEQGVLYTALAGLLNLLAILDVVYQDPRLRENDTKPAGGGKNRKPSPKPSPGSPS